MSALLRVAVVGGGQNCEHDVSLASARAVAAALDPQRHDVRRLTIERDGAWTLPDGSRADLAAALIELTACDVVLPIVHGPRGEDGALAALCELAGVPYAGSGLRAGALAMDKWATKLAAEAVGIATAAGTLVTAATALTTDAAVRWAGPVVVKPVAAGSSHGVTLVRKPDQLAAALATALALDDRVLVEEVLIGREVDIAVLALAGGERLLSPPLEIRVQPGRVFGTEHKYDGSADFRLPADLTEVEVKELEIAALAVFDALGCAGLARVDFFLTDHGWVLNEVNTMPGMTAESQAPRMFAAIGMDHPALVEALVQGALAR